VSGFPQPPASFPNDLVEVGSLGAGVTPPEVGGIKAVGAGTFSGVLDARGGTRTASAAPYSAPVFTSGTAAQLAQTSQDVMLYTTVTLGGTLTLAIGPNNTTGDTIVNAAAVTTGEVISTRIPAGWYIKFTLVTATIATVAVGC